jgi:hypothetical protein
VGIMLLQTANPLSGGAALSEDVDVDAERRQ